MNLISLNIPPGIVKLGTKYQSKGRYFDSNLVRYYGGYLTPVGGWQLFKNSIDNSNSILPADQESTFRDSFSWLSVTGSPNAVFGSNDALFLLNSAGSLTDITPENFTPSINKPSVNTGYGSGPYSIQAYGVTRQGVKSIFSDVKRWKFSAWGSDLIALFKPKGVLYSYTLGDSFASLIPNAPIDVNDVIVTPERFLMCIGSETELNKVSWSDRENRELWSPASENEAGSIVLIDSGFLVSIGVVNNSIVVIGSDLHIGTYIGPPFVYGFETAGKDCEPLDKKSVVYTNSFVVWLGRRQFWLYDGSLKPLPCPIIDWIFKNLDVDKTSVIFTFNNTQYNEVWWFFDGIDQTKYYFSWDYVNNIWHVGKIDRTTALGSSHFSDPIMVGNDGTLYRHEQKAIVPEDAYIETGPLELQQGSTNMVVRNIILDTAEPKTVEVSVYGSQMPTSNEYEYGPYEYNNPTPVRAEGRSIRLKIKSAGNIPWKLGTVRLDVTSGGRR